MKTIVVMPAYNATHTLREVVSKIPSIIDEIILVDDASQDNTVSVAKSLGLQVHEHKENKGYGANQKSCYNMALERGADNVIMIHPDGQHDPSELTKLVNVLAINESSVVYASRMVNSKIFKSEMPFWRYIANITLTKFANKITGANLTDWHTGYRGYSRSALLNVDYNKFPDGFEFDTHMTSSLVNSGIEIKEVFAPAIYMEESSSIGFLRSVKYGINFIGKLIFG